MIVTTNLIGTTHKFLYLNKYVNQLQSDIPIQWIPQECIDVHEITLHSSLK